MDAYIFQADLYCSDCARDIKRKLSPPKDIDNESSYDSDDYPKGAYADGGGESDSPAHCGNSECEVFLENPLTPDGYKYLIESIREHIGQGRGDLNVLLEWASYYDISLEQVIRNSPNCL